MFNTRVRRVGEDCKRHFGCDLRKRPDEEVRRTHARVHRTKRMFDGLAALTHGFLVRIKALLHGFERMLVLPSGDTPLRPRPALRLERAALARGGPAAPQHLAGFFVRIAIWQPLASSAAIGIFLGQIDEVLLAEAPLRALAPDVSGFDSLT